LCMMECLKNERLILTEDAHSAIFDTQQRSGRGHLQNNCHCSAIWSILNRVLDHRMDNFFQNIRVYRRGINWLKPVEQPHRSTPALLPKRIQDVKDKRYDRKGPGLVLRGGNDLLHDLLNLC